MSRPSPEHKGHKPVKGHTGKSREGKRRPCEMETGFPIELIAAQARHRGSTDAEGPAPWGALSSGSRAPGRAHVPSLWSSEQGF